MSANDSDRNEQEFVPEDDAAIGRALRLSLVGLGSIGLVAGGIYYATRPAETAPETEVVDVAPPELVVRDVAPPLVRFTDVASAAGVDFLHENGARGRKLLPETMGGGVACFDPDGDGDTDLLFVNGRAWTDAGPDSKAPATLAFYANDGAGNFHSAAAEFGLDLSLQGQGVAVGDIDRDGDVDLYLTAVGPNRLLRNDNGRFTDITAEARAAGPSDAWSTSAAFFDAQNDGWLDLFVCNYVKWSAEIDEALDHRLTGVGRAYGPPTAFQGVFSTYFVNEGAVGESDIRFRDSTVEAGIAVTNPATGTPAGKALGVVPVDVDGDGDLDLAVANDTVQNFLFVNRGDGTFEECGGAVGIGFDRNGNSTGAMGIDVADYRGDGALGFAIANFANEMSSLYVAQGAKGRTDALRFADEAITEGIGGPTRSHLSFGLFFFDYDLDGRLDLLQSNGHLEQDIQQVQPSQRYAQSPQLFWNAGTGHRSTFVEVDNATAGDLIHPIVGRGAAYADLDGDGDLDVVLAQSGGAPLVLRNDQALDHHWLRVTLRGTRANPDAIGAWIEVESNGTVQRRQVMPSRSYLSQVELPVTFGLGESTTVQTVRVLWPGGGEQVLTEVSVDRTLEITQDR